MKLEPRTRNLALVATLAAAPILGAQARQTRPELTGTRADSANLARAFGTIDGAVSDTSLAPLQGAFVSILGTRIRVGTGPNGKFRITKIPSGQYLVVVKRVGFRPASAIIDVPSTDTLRLAYTLEPVAVQLATVTTYERPLSLKMSDFLARKKLGIGQFMTQEQIDANNAVFSTELFRRFTSINVSPNRARQLTEYFALSQREGGNPITGACPMSVVIDDVPLPTPFNLDLLPPPRELAGIEVYAGPSTAPAKYNGFNRGCGVILIWTRDG